MKLIASSDDSAPVPLMPVASKDSDPVASIKPFWMSRPADAKRALLPKLARAFWVTLFAPNIFAAPIESNVPDKSRALVAAISSTPPLWILLVALVDMLSAFSPTELIPVMAPTLTIFGAVKAKALSP